MRKKPIFTTGSSRSQNNETSSWGCLWLFLIAVGGFFVYRSIDRVWSGRGNRIDQMICYGVLLGFVILVISVTIQGAQDMKRLSDARQQWRSTCKSVEVGIVDRRFYPGGSWEEYDIPHTSRPSYHLDLELTPEQRVISPNLQSVRVDVDEKIYFKILDRNVVRVYYQPESPMVFLLEEELDKT